jgi:hypothetical protein
MALSWAETDDRVSRGKGQMSRRDRDGCAAAHRPAEQILHFAALILVAGAIAIIMRSGQLQ